jgi:hypothetical protein
MRRTRCSTSTALTSGTKPTEFATTRFAYNLSPNDSLQSINDVKGDDAMRKRLAMLKVDPLNPHRCPTTFGAYESESSYIELPGAPPLVWSLPVAENRRGRVTVTSIHSAYLKKDKKLWV